MDTSAPETATVAQPAPTQEVVAIKDGDRDAVHILPLSIIPLKTKGLHRTRMIKNSYLKSVVELFDGEGTGAGHVDVESLNRVFTNIEPSDIAILRKLAKLYSYDVFGLRILLRDLGIEVDNFDDLKLSDAKQNELNDYMKQFTQRLIVEIYGGNDDTIKDYSDVVALFQHPDVAMAKKKLDQMANQLGIGLADVPQFLEDYGDIYLSVAYFRQVMDKVKPAIEDFNYTVNEILGHPQLRQDGNLVATSKRLQAKVNKLNEVVIERFRIFAKSTEEMWVDINADRFREFKSLVESNHTAIGGILCTLSVKMDAWSQKFPQRSSGGPVKRAEFILTDMRQGM